MPAAPQDAAGISALIDALCAPFFVHPDRRGAEAFLASISPAAIERLLSRDDFWYHVLRIDGTLAGVVALRDRSHLHHLFVARAFQGRGMARAMWQAAMRQAVSAGNPGCFTVNASLNAVPVYARLGFVASGLPASLNGIAFQPMQLLLDAHRA